MNGVEINDRQGEKKTSQSLLKSTIHNMQVVKYGIDNVALLQEGKLVWFCIANLFENYDNLYVYVFKVAFLQ